MIYLTRPDEKYAQSFPTIHDLWVTFWADVSVDIQERYFDLFKASKILDVPFDADFNPDAFTLSEKKAIVDWYFQECLGCESNWEIVKL